MAVALAQNEQLPRANVRPASEPFPEEQFVTIPNVPVFAEHQTKSRDGRTLRFSRDELQAVANRCNQRISETGDYAAISVGHTSDPGEPHQTPEVIGAAGPFRLGLLGESGQRQRYCILADFHVRRDRLDRYNANPRRSPELWLEDSYDEMFLDPISLLGAEAPRLDMGLTSMIDAKGSDGAFSHLYSAQKNGRLREKYAAASPGDCNVFVPAMGNDKPKHYAAEPAQDQTERKTLMLQPEDIRQIVDAIEGLDWVQEVKQLLTVEQAENQAMETPPVPGGEPPIDEAAIAPGAALPDAQAGTTEPPPMEPNLEEPPVVPGKESAPPVPPKKEEPEPKKNYSAEGNAPKGSKETVGPKLDSMSDEEIEKYLCERKKKKYSAEGTVEGDGVKPAAGEVEGHAGATAAEGSVAGESQSENKAKYSALQGRIDKLEADRVERIEEARTARLGQLRYHRAFDLNKEVERCRYSKMNDDQFNEHTRVISENYIPTNANAPLPVPDELLDSKMAPPSLRPQPERYSKEAAEQAVKYCTELAMQGKTPSYERVLENIVNGRPAEWTA